MLVHQILIDFDVEVVGGHAQLRNAAELRYLLPVVRMILTLVHPVLDFALEHLVRRLHGLPAVAFEAVD